MTRLFFICFCCSEPVGETSHSISSLLKKKHRHTHLITVNYHNEAYARVVKTCIKVASAAYFVKLRIVKAVVKRVLKSFFSPLFFTLHLKFQAGKSEHNPKT